MSIHVSNKVKTIIEFIQGKIDNLKEKLSAYDTPIMQDLAKTSQHIQYDYIRLKTELQANEENLLLIKKFMPETPPAISKPDKNKSSSKDEKSKHKA